jgi:hypothetical protein
MITLRVWFLVVATGSLVAGCGRTHTPKPASIHVVNPSATVMDGLDLLQQAGLPHFDLYGNPIDDAVTDYRIDQGGAVYERHSPDTEVPRLRPPVS